VQVELERRDKFYYHNPPPHSTKYGLNCSQTSSNFPSIGVSGVGQIGGHHDSLDVAKATCYASAAIFRARQMHAAQECPCGFDRPLTSKPGRATLPKDVPF